MSKAPKKRNPTHLEQRNGLWFAVLTIPKECRPLLKNKVRYIKSLETHSQKEAVDRSYKLIAKWKAEIAFIRGFIGEVVNKPLLERAQEFKRIFEGLPEEKLLKSSAYKHYQEQKSIFIPTPEIESFDDEAMREAIDRLLLLTETEGIRERCRKVALRCFSLEEGVRCYDALYKRLLTS